MAQESLDADIKIFKRYSRKNDIILYQIIQSNSYGNRTSRRVVIKLRSA